MHKVLSPVRQDRGESLGGSGRRDIRFKRRVFYFYPFPHYKCYKFSQVDRCKCVGLIDRVMHSSVNTASSGIACAVKCARLSVQYMESSGAVWGSMVASAEISCKLFLLVLIFIQGVR